MSGEGYFETLEAQLAALTRQGAHLGPPARRAYARRRALRRGGVAALSSAVLAVGLVSEFPASAGGHEPPSPTVHTYRAL